MTHPSRIKVMKNFVLLLFLTLGSSASTAYGAENEQAQLNDADKVLVKAYLTSIKLDAKSIDQVIGAMEVDKNTRDSMLQAAKLAHDTQNLIDANNKKIDEVKSRLDAANKAAEKAEQETASSTASAVEGPK
jgi:hypothetical protein